MISKGFVAYIVLALAAVPSLTANPTPSEPAANPTLTPTIANAGHSCVPPADAGTSATAPATPPAPAAPATPASGKPAAANDTSAAHPPASASTPPSSGAAVNGTKDLAHPPAPAQNQSITATPPPATNATAHPPSPANNSHDAASTTTPKKAPVAPPELPLVPSCYSKKKTNGVETHHCEKALDKVVYAANQTLDKFSSVIFANYKTCNINVFKPKNATLTKVQVSSMVRNITDACHSVGGVVFKTTKIVVKVERGNGENTYEVSPSVCKKEECPLTQGDCLSAFYQIPLKGKSFSRVTSGNCTVTVSTTDYSNFDVTRADVYPTMKKLFNDCGRHPGKIYLPGGATGFNGDIKISTRATNHEFCD